MFRIASRLLPSDVPWGEYYALCKPKVVLLLVFTAIVGMCMATTGVLPLAPLVLGSIGIALVAAAGAAYNQVIDERIDVVMARTKGRPLPTGRLDRTSALVFASVLCAIGMAILLLGVNALTAWLTFASMIGYSVVYTAFLKRVTPQNIVIGGAAGATPPVLGWTAVTGELHPHALLLFLIIFAWTPPHFWALAIDRQLDYARASVPMLPVTHGAAFTRLHILLYTVILFLCSLLPYLTGLSGLPYLCAALVLSGMFLQKAASLYVAPAPRKPIKLFVFSIHYLAALFTALLADHYLVA